MSNYNQPPNNSSNRPMGNDHHQHHHHRNAPPRHYPHPLEPANRAPRRNLLQDDDPVQHRGSGGVSSGPGTRSVGHVHLQDRNRARYVQQQKFQRQQQKRESFQRQQQQQQQAPPPAAAAPPIHQPEQFLDAREEARQAALRKRERESAKNDQHMNNPPPSASSSRNHNSTFQPPPPPGRSTLQHRQNHGLSLSYAHQTRPPPPPPGNRHGPPPRGYPERSAAAEAPNNTSLGPRGRGRGATLPAWLTNRGGGGSLSEIARPTGHPKNHHDSSPTNHHQSRPSGSTNRDDSSQHLRQQSHSSTYGNDQHYDRASGSSSAVADSGAPPPRQYNQHSHTSASQTSGHPHSSLSTGSTPARGRAQDTAPDRQPETQQQTSKQVSEPNQKAREVVELLDTSSDEEGPVNPISRKRASFNGKTSSQPPPPSSSTSTTAPQPASASAPSSSQTRRSSLPSSTSSSQPRRPSDSLAQRPAAMADTERQPAARLKLTKNSPQTTTTTAAASQSGSHPSAATGNSASTASRLKLTLKHTTSSKGKSAEKAHTSSNEPAASDSAPKAARRQSTGSAVPKKADTQKQMDRRHSADADTSLIVRKAPPSGETQKSAGEETEARKKKPQDSSARKNNTELVIELSSDESDGESDDEESNEQRKQSPKATPMSGASKPGHDVQPALAIAAKESPKEQLDGNGESTKPAKSTSQATSEEKQPSMATPVPAASKPERDAEPESIIVAANAAPTEQLNGDRELPKPAETASKAKSSTPKLTTSSTPAATGKTDEADAATEKSGGSDKEGPSEGNAKGSGAEAQEKLSPPSYSSSEEGGTEDEQEPSQPKQKRTIARKATLGSPSFGKLPQEDSEIEDGGDSESDSSSESESESESESSTSSSSWSAYHSENKENHRRFAMKVPASSAEQIPQHKKRPAQKSAPSGFGRPNSDIRTPKSSATSASSHQEEVTAGKLPKESAKGDSDIATGSSAPRTPSQTPELPKPKQPQDAFTIFVKESLANRCVSQEHLRNEWKDMPSEDRDDYMRKAEQDIRRYNRECKAYSKDIETKKKEQKKAFNPQKRHASSMMHDGPSPSYHQQQGPQMSPYTTTWAPPHGQFLFPGNSNGFFAAKGLQLPYQATMGNMAFQANNQMQRFQIQQQLQQQQWQWAQMHQIRQMQQAQKQAVIPGAQQMAPMQAAKKPNENEAELRQARPGHPPKSSRKRKKSSDDEDDEEYDEPAILPRPEKAATPSPFMARRCRRNPVRYSQEVFDSEYDAVAAMMSPHATAGATSVDDLEEMIKVKHLDSIEINPKTGKPVGRFTCHGTDADILYDFQVDVKQSGIPNAGYGAFLTFLGARKLKPESQGRKKAERHGLLFTDDLTAMSEDGFGINVRLVGDSIDGGVNSNPRAIGPGGIYAESDYEPSPKTRFCTFAEGNGFIHLGRYGPFRKIDRKPILHFEVKSFLFSYEPSEWCFGVLEKLYDREEQLVDITDDVTGKTHELAEKNLPMYVNEVGHSKELVHNVDSRDLHDRSVEYYIRIDKPMKKGQQIELLTNYFDHYEDVRERKGYGLKNLKLGLKSDDDIGALLSRNFDSREHIEVEINELASLDPAVVGDNIINRVFDLVEFLDERIRTPLVEKTEKFLIAIESGECEAKSAEVPSSLQWVALLRFEWLGPKLLKALFAMEKSFENAPKGSIQVSFPWKSMIEQCKIWVSKMKWAKFAEFWRLCKDMKDNEGKNIHDAVRREIVEMLCYELRTEIRLPFDPSIWCQVSQDLVYRLCDEIGTAQLLRGSKDLVSTAPSLLGNVLALAADAVGEIHKEAAAFQDRYTKLDFSSGVPSNATVCARQIGALRKKCFQYNCMDPKGVVAALADFLAYFDCAFLADDHLLSGNFSVPVKFDRRFLMTKYGGFKIDSQLSSLPRSVEDARKSKAVVNETWYIMWQVVHVVHAFGMRFLNGGDPSGSEGYSLERLCRHLGVDSNLAQEAVTRGILQRTIWEKVAKPPKNNPKSEAKKSTKERGEESNTEGKVNKTATTKEAKKQKQSGSGTCTPDLNIAFGVARPKAVEVWQGVPDEPLEGGWPEGWTKKLYARQSGATKDRQDRYWFSPKMQYKFRSMREVQTFLSCLRMLGNTQEDEKTAWRMFKAKT